MTDLKDIWTRAKAYLRGQVDTGQYEMWIATLQPLGIEEHKVTLGVLNEMCAIWMGNNFKDVIEEALNIATGEVYDVLFQVIPDAKKTAVESTAPTVSVRRKVAPKAETAPVSVAKAPKLVEDGSLVTLDRRFTFDEFVVGDCNRIAYAVSNAVAEKPGSQYNPYFIYSGTGMGKTHLLQAIAQEVLRRTPSAKVMYVTSEDMLNQYVDAIAHDAMAFRRKYRSLDVLLIDDVQFLGKTERFQEEFFHTFNALYKVHKQIVMTSDRPPQEINGLEKRLVSRFECGFTAEIQQPDLETRIAIIHKKQEHHAYKLDEAVIRFVAEHCRSSIRLLESSVFRLVSTASMLKINISVKDAEKILADVMSKESESSITVDSIQKTVAEHYDLRVSDITGPRRLANIATPRQIAMYLSRKMTELSAASVAERFSRNHATVVHAVQTIEAKLEKSEEFRRELEQIKRKLVKA